MRSLTFEEVLAEGNRRSLGRAEEIVGIVIRHPDRFEELFDCIFSEDEIVRMRASDALEKVCRQRPDLFQPYTSTLLTEVSKINQPSVQWHLAQIIARLTLNTKDKATAISVLKINLLQSKDWIVLNWTLDSLAKFALDDARLRQWFIGVLRQYQGSDYKSIASRARRLLAQLEE
jgi:hypothetical protein